MTRIAAILILLCLCASVAKSESFYTLQNSTNLTTWETVALITNDAPAKFIRLQQWQRKSWNPVTNAVSYTVWWMWNCRGGYIETTQTNALIPAGVEVWITAKDAIGNDSNPSDTFTL